MKIHKHPSQVRLNLFMQGKVKETLRLIDKKYTKKSDLHIRSYEDINDIIYKLTKFRLTDTDIECGGYFSYYNKEIAIRDLKNRGIWSMVSTCFHEVGHFFQYKYNTSWFNRIHGLRVDLNFEQEAETFNYRVLEMLQGNYNLFKDQDNHYAYFNRDDAEWLNDWHGYEKNEDYYSILNIFKENTCETHGEILCKN